MPIQTELEAERMRAACLSLSVRGPGLAEQALTPQPHHRVASQQGDSPL